MRRLWITRRKAAAACLGKMKVYIEDPLGEARINGFPCRRLGTLKNGQKACFSIGTGAARLFVVADSLSRNLYNEFVDLPEGEEDVFLTGQNILKPFAGNPFHFDGAASEAVEENRQAVSRRAWILTVLALIASVAIGTAAGLAAAVAERDAAPKVFAAEELRITLTEDFAEVKVPGYTACFSDGHTTVFALREVPDPAVYGELSLDVYGAMILANNGFDQSVRLEKTDGLTTFTAPRENPATGEVFFCCCGLFRSADAYWLVQITAPGEGTEALENLFRQWLRGTSFAE